MQARFYVLSSRAHARASRGTLCRASACLLPGWGCRRVDMLLRRIFEPARSQILPSRIESRDQPQLLFSSPALQLLFARNRFVTVVVALPVHETYGIVLIGKTLVPVHFVLENTAVKIVGHADVEGPPG